MPPADTPTPTGSIGAAIRRLRDIAGIRQDALAAAVGISPGHLSRFENGKRDISRPTYDALVQALAVEGTRQRHEAGAA